jgi:carboxypeptidase T
MKSLLSTFIFSILILSVSAQHKRLKVWSSPGDILQMTQAGIAVDHVIQKPNRFIIGEFSKEEIEKIDQLGLPYDILVDDLQAYYIAQNASTKDLENNTCESQIGGFVFDDPENFELGSMGGFFTYEEFIEHIDYMAETWPNIISAKQPIADFQTHEGRDIYWLRISDNPNADEEETEVLYTALHHAREPASLSQLIFYMYYLLENYGTDETVTALIDNTEMYFVPMINPDGYIHNQTTNPNGGGMWRKNKRDNNGNLNDAGVDLNRNYGYEWGGLGTSNSFSSEIYRGSEPFSEPETQAIKFLCENHQFKFALNYHTYSNLLLYPFGFDFNELTEDNDYFEGFTEEMVRYNQYANIISSDLYAASGVSDDWMYAGDSKPKILSMTPEVGEEFWPPESGILELCRENLYMNLLLPQLANATIRVELESESFLGEVQEGILDFSVQTLGLNPGNFSVVMESGSDKLTFPEDIAYEFSFSEQLESGAFQAAFSVDPSIQSGDIIPIIARVNNGTYTVERKFQLTYGLLNEFYYTNCNSMGIFETNGWGLTTASAVSSPYSITDSPNGNYENGSNEYIEIEDPFDLTELNSAFLTFYAKWDIEQGWDYAQVLISTDNGITWIPQCGRYTVTGNQYQDEDQPVYDGTQLQWNKEVVSLEDYLGEEIRVRFRLVSDGFITGDGFYFDDLKIETYDVISSIATQEAYSFDIYPNPADNEIVLKAGQKGIGQVYRIYNVLGAEITSGAIYQSEQRLNVAHLVEGFYLIQVGNSTLKKIQISR